MVGAWLLLFGLSLHVAGNKGCGIWIMSSSLPHITNNRICHNSIYGVAVFCRKDDANDYLANQGGNENFNDEGEAASWENDLDSEDERFTSRRPISVALVESNSINHNGGERGLSCLGLPQTCCPGADSIPALSPRRDVLGVSWDCGDHNHSNRAALSMMEQDEYGGADWRGVMPSSGSPLALPCRG